MSKIRKCSVYGSIFLNFAMLLAACSIIAVGLWIRYDADFEPDLKTIFHQSNNDVDPLKSDKFYIRVWILVTYWVITGFSLFAIVISIVGIVGVVQQNRCLLLTYLSQLVALIVFELIAFFYILCVRNSQIHSLIKQFVFDEYNELPNNSDEILILQSKYQCCGSDNLPNFLCVNDQPTCSTAIWSSVNHILMISVFVFLAILLLQLIAIILVVPLLVTKTHKFRTALLGHF